MGRHKIESYIPKIYSRTVKWNSKAKNGELKQRKSKVYYVRWYDATGREHRRSTEFTFKADAVSYAYNMTKEEMMKDGNIPIYNTFGEFASLFFVDGTCPIMNRKRNRGEEYENRSYAKWTHGQVERHIIKHLGNKTFSELTTQVIQDWLDSLPTKDNIRHDSANKQLNFLSQICDEALKQNLIKENPCFGVKRLTADRRNRHAYTTDQITRLFSSPWDDVLSYYAAIVAAASGARLSEVLAIKPCKLLVDSNEILFDRSYSRTGEKSIKNKYEQTSPVPSQIMQKLVEFAKTRNPNEYLFSYDGKTPIKREQLYSALYVEMEKRGIDRFSPNGKILDKNKDLPLGFHSFRTTLNTVLLKNGVPEPEVRRVLRQISPSSSKFYTDIDNVDTSKTKRVMNSMNLGADIIESTPS